MTCAMGGGGNLLQIVTKSISIIVEYLVASNRSSKSRCARTISTWEIWDRSLHLYSFLCGGVN